MDNIFWSYSFPMRKGILDDDYLFFEDGRILHSFDKTQSKLNIEEFVIAEEIPQDKREIILRHCPNDKYDFIKSILKI